MGWLGLGCEAISTLDSVSRAVRWRRIKWHGKKPVREGGEWKGGGVLAERKECREIEKELKIAPSERVMKRLGGKQETYKLW